MKTAILFPGYGIQHIGMGKSFYTKYANVRSLFDEASSYLGIDCAALCFSSSETDINQLYHAYISIFLVSCSICDIIKQHNTKLVMVAGYDTGQYAALYAANAIAFSSGLGLLKRYSELYMHLIENNGYEIIKINGLTSTKLPEYLTNQATIASYLSRTQHLVSGTTEGIENLREKLRNASGVTIYDENIGIGLNSQLMDPVVKQFKPYLKQTKFNNLDIPLITNVDGSLITNAEQVQEDIIKLINDALRWDKVVDTLSTADCIVGIGSVKNLLDLVIEKYPNKNIISIETAQDLKHITR